MQRRVLSRRIFLFLSIRRRSASARHEDWKDIGAVSGRWSSEKIFQGLEV
jgi:hypothetical protein